jgi:hypothetical protein
MQHNDDGGRAMRALGHTVTEIRTTLNNGLETMVQEQKAKLTIVKNDIQVIRDALTSHVAKEDVIYEIFKRVMNTGVSITGALIALLLAIIGICSCIRLGCSDRRRAGPIHRRPSGLFRHKEHVSQEAGVEAGLDVKRGRELLLDQPHAVFTQLHPFP